MDKNYKRFNNEFNHTFIFSMDETIEKSYVWISEAQLQNYLIKI